MHLFGNLCFRLVLSVRSQFLATISSTYCRLTLKLRFLYPVNVHLPKDRISMAHQGYGFCEFLTEEDAEYACKIMNQIKLWGKPIRVNKVLSQVDQAVVKLLSCSFRLRRTRNSSTSAPTFSSATSTKMWMNDCCTTHSVALESLPPLQKFVVQVIYGVI